MNIYFLIYPLFIIECVTHYCKQHKIFKKKLEFLQKKKDKNPRKKFRLENGCSSASSSGIHQSPIL